MINSSVIDPASRNPEGTIIKRIWEIFTTAILLVLFLLVIPLLSVIAALTEQEELE
ncbi:hypothetical protein W02_42540 [Nitrospira sp. KM1]|uniref:hypothetical protein n=1 Tax=Nitrospira sp. KM1 TaxID=1936990 RepID=UPI0013A76D24|nr:hypothetical protein [Nitrospira sp. KM1]BCA57114.1 hypothetical protein W02_42540 [Nitrospira sp. KM1]